MRTKLFLCLALVVMSPSAGRSQNGGTPSVPSAADFAELPFLTDPVLSPNGDRFVARGVVGAKPQLILVRPREGAAPESISIEIPDTAGLNWVQWAGNEKLLASFMLKYNMSGSGYTYLISRLLTYDIGTDQWSEVGPRTYSSNGDDVIHVDPDGRFLLLSMRTLSTRYPAVWRVDLATGKSTKIVDPHANVWNWYADSTGVVRAGIGNTLRRWWVVYRESESGEFKRLSKRDFDEETGIDGFHFVPGSHIGYTVARKASGRYGMYRYDFSSDQILEPVWEHTKVDLEGVSFTPVGALRGVSYTDERRRVEWFDPQMKALQAKLDKLMPGGLRVASIDRAGNRMILESASAADPGRYFIYDRRTNQLSLIADSYSRLAGKPLADVVPVTYAARDGLEIPAYLTLPTGSDPKGLPLIIMPHGGPFVRDNGTYDPWVQFLASRGYAVLQPNYRGSTGYGLQFVRKGEGEWGRGMQDDIDDGVRWLVAKGTVDPDRVCIMGASFGGYAAMWATVRNPDIYRCAISFAGVSDVGALMAYDRYRFVAHRYYRDWREKVEGEKSFDLDAISPLEQVARVAIPILIAHGTLDARVPVGQSERFHEALQKLGKPHEYVAYKEEGHGFNKAENAADFLQRVEAFLDKHNPA